MMNFLRSIYLNKRLFFIAGGLVVGFVFAYFFPFLFPTMQAGVALLSAMTLVDVWILYRSRHGFEARRVMSERFSNGDYNTVRLEMQNRYSFATTLEIIDEIPIQFQKRDLLFSLNINARSEKRIEYLLRPTERGEFAFGVLNIYVLSPFQLIKRRYRFEEGKTIPVYPSYLQMKKYELMAISNRLNEIGVKKIRRLGHTTEFEQIKPYVRGDDHRTVNWKATGRTGQLMVNQYTDEKAQNVYFVVDKSRNMKMPFDGLMLMDYAINTTLVVSNIAIHKHDKAGLITFAEKIHQGLPADNKPTQMNLILETLYNQTTRFPEADFERLYIFIKRKITQRSLIMIYSNFESLSAMRRQLPFLRKIAHHHLLVVVFFENTELKELIVSKPKNTEEVYMKAIGESFVSEKRQIVMELEQNGVHAILTAPENLTVNALNKYLEIKSRGMI